MYLHGAGALLAPYPESLGTRLVPCNVKQAERVKPHKQVSKETSEATTELFSTMQPVTCNTSDVEFLYYDVTSTTSRNAQIMAGCNCKTTGSGNKPRPLRQPFPSYSWRACWRAWEDRLAVATRLASGRPAPSRSATCARRAGAVFPSAPRASMSRTAASSAPSLCSSSSPGTQLRPAPA